MDDTRQTLGAAGEDAALRLYLGRGYQLVARNWCDDVALSAARAIEKAIGGWRPASVIP